MLRECGIPVNDCRIASNEGEARAAARDLGFPVVAKTAERGAYHKSDQDGVRLGLADESAVAAAYRDLAARIGPRVLIAPMVLESGAELLLGLVRDEQFGPLVVLGFGGLHVEALGDVAYALPPFDADEARRLLGRLKLSPLLTSRRFRRPLALDSFCAAAARLSALAVALGEAIQEIELNPVIVHAGGCMAVDALVAGRRRTPGNEEEERCAV